MRGFRHLPRVLVLGALAASAWVVVVHPGWLKPAERPGEDDKVDSEVPVQTTKIVRATLHRSIAAYGCVVPEPAGPGKPAASARIAAPCSGIIRAAGCVEGGIVKAGDLLFQMDDRIAASEEEKASAAVDRARSSVEFAGKVFDRHRKLMDEDATAARKLEEAQFQLVAARNDLVSTEKALAATRVQRSLLNVQSPLAGTVVHVRASAGEAVEQNMVLAEVIDLDRLCVPATVPAAQIGLVKLGQPVEVSPQTPGLSDDAPAHKGVLVFIGFDVDRKIDAVSIRASLPADERVRPGEYVKIRIIVDEHPERLVVPKESVVSEADGKGVVALVEGVQAIQKPVRIGFSERGLVEIEGEGLKEGDDVVTAGAYGLPERTKIRVIAR